MADDENIDVAIGERYIGADPKKDREEIRKTEDEIYRFLRKLGPNGDDLKVHKALTRLKSIAYYYVEKTMGF